MGTDCPISSIKAIRELNFLAHEFFYFIRMMATDNEILKNVEAFAAEAHGKQMRKYADEQYIHHPIRVMETVRTLTQDVTMLAAALLHDVLEDTPVGPRELGNFLSTVMDKPRAERTLDLVEELTDVYVKADYPTMNRRTRRTKEAGRLSDASPDAQTIKYADVIDNSVDISHQETDFALVYLRECKQLLQEINKGNPQLYERAVRTVDECLREFWNKSNVKAL